VGILLRGIIPPAVPPSLDAMLRLIRQAGYHVSVHRMMGDYVELLGRAHHRPRQRRAYLARGWWR
jgi:hypothetical protein